MIQTKLREPTETDRAIPSYTFVTNKAKPVKIPAYFTYHWEKNALPTGSWWLAKDGPPSKQQIAEGFFAVFHPEQGIEGTMLPCVVEKLGGFTQRIEIVDLPKYIKIKSKLSWRQRLTGIL